jgi:hypothetical protein
MFYTVLRIRIRDPVPFRPLDPESGMGKNQDLDRDEHFGSYFRELRNNFWVKIHKFFDADADSGSGNLFDPVSGMENFGSGIRADPQHCLCRKEPVYCIPSNFRLASHYSYLASFCCRLQYICGFI